METQMAYILECMEAIMAIPSPGGFTESCTAYIEKEFVRMGYSVSRTNKNALMVTIKGVDDEAQKMISGHVDTLGAIVKEIKPNGRLLLAQIGGFSWNSVEGENVLVHRNNGVPITGSLMPIHASIHIDSELVRTMERTDETVEVRLDAVTDNADMTRALGVNVGDFVSFETRYVQCENGFIKSRYLDDKSAVAIILGLCKSIKEKGLTPKYTLHFCISNYEEIGHGVSYIPPKTDTLIAIDIGPVGPRQTSTEFAVSIAAKDSRTPYDYKLRQTLAEVCVQNNIDHHVDVYNRYGSDASIGVLQGFNVNFACIGPGVDSTHHYERTHVKAIENTAKLLWHYAVQD
ncbi:M42 family metallopeptidase [Fusibacter ferrireducens]|uniref:M42 family metallopeptidase n=1 Tax=Fusibacter ferrireducens TaxID=2785058 RepID=A0ABR9ZUV4_9FIRM|nr:M42 family metallopeptidase [Fusibacter ferrireducens]MBF4694220.1 M42 family metallopeptidase [Fusibacter ferrireducens]